MSLPTRQVEFLEVVSGDRKKVKIYVFFREYTKEFDK
jgi:hypothetical protein